MPGYLCPGASDHVAGHIGTTDVDVALSVAVGDVGSAAYSTLEKNLKRAGLERVGGSSWRWCVEVDGLPVVLELLGEDADTPSGRLFRPKVLPPAGAGGLDLLCVRGASLTARDYVEVTREVRLLDGSISSVRLRVAGPAAFLALKADAYLDRREPKDAYDLVWLLLNWPSGPSGLGRAVRGADIGSEAFVLDAFSRLDADFVTTSHAGPRDYAGFVTYVALSGDVVGAREDALGAWRRFRGAFGG